VRHVTVLVLKPREVVHVHDARVTRSDLFFPLEGTDIVDDETSIVLVDHWRFASSSVPTPFESLNSQDLLAFCVLYVLMSAAGMAVLLVLIFSLS